MVQTSRRYKPPATLLYRLYWALPSKSVNSVYDYSTFPKATDVIWLKTSWCCWQKVPTERVWIFSYLFLILFLFFKIWRKKKGNKLCFCLTLLMNSIPFYSRRDTTIWSSKDMWILSIDKSDLWKRSDWQLCELKACTHSVSWTHATAVQSSLSSSHWGAPVFY